MRIVSLLASATEMVAALGCLDQMVGRSHECDYPPEVRALPIVSRARIDVTASSAEIDAQVKRLAQARYAPADPALEALSIYAIELAQLQVLRPDVIFTQTQCDVCAVSERDVTQALARLAGLRPQVVALCPFRLQDVWADVERVGAALGRSAQAHALVEGYERRLTGLANQTTGLGSRPRVVVLEWLDPLMGGGNWTPELVTCAGGESLVGQAGQHSPWLSWEELRAVDPDVLVLAPCGYPLERTLQDLPVLQQQPIWANLRAVRNGRVYAIDGNAYLNRSGPRLVDSAELLARVIWDEQAQRLDLAVDDAGWRRIPSSSTSPA